MAHDAVRFSLNALETVHSIRPSASFNKMNAWHLIQVYYAAFFAAHSTLRLFGRPFTQLEPGHVRALYQRALSEQVAVPKGISSGNSLGIYDPNLNTVSFVNQSDSHKDMWTAFTKLLNDMSTQVLLARGIPDELAEISSEFRALADLLCNGGKFQSGNWLSSVRNEVNYRSPVEVWYPFTKATPDAHQNFNNVKGWKTGKLTSVDCLSLGTQYEKFFATCMMVVQVNRSLIDDYVSIAQKGCTSAAIFKKFSGLAQDAFEA